MKLPRHSPIFALGFFFAALAFAEIITFQASDGSLPRVSPTTPLPVILTTTTSDTGNKATLVSGAKIPASTAAPEAIAAAGTYVQAVTIFAQHNSQGAANTSSVYVDWTAGNGTQLIEIPVGSFQVITAPPGKFLDLGDIYVDAVTSGDGVIFRGFK